MSLEPYYQSERVTLYHGDCREVLADMDAGGIDLVLTDPPYSSGGTMRSDRNQPTSAKYQRSGIINIRPEFAGDSRDQRSFLIWCDLWMRDCLRVCRSGSALMSFIDWRNLPVMVDAVQVAGFVYRGLLAWDKTEAARPQKGWFRSQLEYCVLATCGPANNDGHGKCSPGLFRYPAPRFRTHSTEKPVELVRDMIATGERWQTVLDPFMGSGTTGVAAIQLGRKFIGIELEERYCEISAKRIQETESQYALFEPAEGGA